ncbi:hypothetical protein OXX59_005164 [Metschnikowia pulcherrima]
MSLVPRDTDGKDPLLLTTLEEPKLEIEISCMRDEAAEGTIAEEKKDMYRALRARAKEEKENAVNEYAQFPRIYANKSTHDEYDLICEIFEYRQLCHVCNSVSHSFSKCKPRRCTVCGTRQHLHAKCSIKCQCKTRPVHTKMEDGSPP